MADPVAKRRHMKARHGSAGKESETKESRRDGTRRDRSLDPTPSIQIQPFTDHRFSLTQCGARAGSPKLLSYFSAAPCRCSLECMTHENLVAKAVIWLRRYGCGVVLSEQSCASGETPDAIGWKRGSHSVIVECKVSRADFFIDQEKPFRRKPGKGMGCERFYLTPAGMLRPEELPAGWGLLELRGRSVEVVCASSKKLRSSVGFRHEMNLLLASLRRVEVRIEPQSITDFLKWKNRMAEYNRGSLPEGILAAGEEANCFLGAEAIEGD